MGITTNDMTFHYLYKKHPNILKMVNDIDFSLDSPYKAEHDNNRGAALYDSVINAVKRCVAFGIKCSIITCGMRRNLTKQYIDDYLSIVAALGCELRINMLKPVEGALMAEMPSREQFYNAFRCLISNTECITLGESCIASLAGQGSAGCPCGRYSFRINAKTKNGTVPISPCVYLHDFRSGDLETGDSGYHSGRRVYGIVKKNRQFAHRMSGMPFKRQMSGRLRCQSIFS